MALKSVSITAGRFLNKNVCSAFATNVTVPANFDWKQVSVPAETLKDIPETIGGIAPKGDLRATSGLGIGDGIKNHTDKWLQVDPGSSAFVSRPKLLTGLGQ